MIRTIAELGVLIEHAAGDLYEVLADAFPDGAPEKETLAGMAREERGHASLMASVVPALPEVSPESRVFLRVLRLEVRFLGEARELRRGVESGSLAPAAALEAAVRLESALVEDLFSYIEPFVSGPLANAVRRMSVESAGHAQRLQRLGAAA